MKKFAEAIRSQGVPRKIGKLAFSTFVLGIMLSSFAIVSALNVRTSLLETFDEVGRMRIRQESERALLGHVVDAETSLHGFILTGDDHYLRPFLAGRESVLREQARQRGARGGAEGSFAAFDAALEKSYAGIAQAVAQARAQWPETGEVRTRLAGIKQAVDTLRAEQATLDAQLTQALDARRGGAKQTVSKLLVALALLSLGLVLLAFAQLRELAIQAAGYLRSERRAADEITGLEKEVALSRAELERVNLQLALTLRSAGVQIFTMAANGAVDWVSDPRSRLSMMNSPPFTLPELAAPEARALLENAVHDVSRLRQERDLELALYGPGVEPRWIKLHLAPQGDADTGTILGCAFDITPLKQREDNNFWLMRELSHRSKNLLAIVQSIARQSARGAIDKSVFLARFSARLSALAASHDLLVQTDYAGARLEALVRSQLVGADYLVGSRILLSGPELIIRAEAAQNLGLALHELASNAMTHGALASEAGIVTVRWQLDPGEREPELVLDWEESGGPLTAPGVPGFGDTLIRTNLPRALEGSVVLTHAPEGTRCHMRLPMRRLRPEFGGTV